MGLSCESKCTFPSYGLGCQSHCNCIDKDCDPANGCRHSSRGTYASNYSISSMQFASYIQFHVKCCRHHFFKGSEHFFNRLGLQDCYNRSFEFQSPNL